MKPLFETDHVVIFSRPVGPFAMNQALIGCKKTGKAALIDSGDRPDAFIQAAKTSGLTIEKLLQTHAHIDHVAGLAATKRALPLPLYLHQDDLQIYEFVPQQAKMYGFPVEDLPPIDHFYAENEIIEIGDLRLEVLHTPGHSPGHVCLYERTHGIMIGGDLLFRQSIGRTDLPLCDPQKMMQSLKRVMELPDEVVVFPGHMEPTTIGFERTMNPFLRNL